MPYDNWYEDAEADVQARGADIKKKFLLSINLPLRNARWVNMPGTMWQLNNHYRSRSWRNARVVVNRKVRQDSVEKKELIFFRVFHLCKIKLTRDVPRIQPKTGRLEKVCESVAPIDRWAWSMTLEKFFSFTSQISSRFKS